SWGAPSSNFDRLIPRLQAEAIMERPDVRVVVRRWSIRIAAAIGFIAIGAVGGRLSSGGTIVGMNPRVDMRSGEIGAQPIAFKTPAEAERVMMASQATY